MNLYKKFEMLLALHCSPTLSGIKPANLVSCYKNEYTSVPHLVNHYNSILNTKNIFLDILCEYDSYYLVIIYNKLLLNNILNNNLSKHFLITLNYKDLNIHSILVKLKYKLKHNSEFPHEIGILLGYPIEDIKGFVDNKGKNYKLLGYWKVYSNEEKTQYTFNSYTNCRKEFCNQILSGNNFLQIINNF